ARRHFVDCVRQLGPLPAIRAGRQPYGLLPATSLELLGANATGGNARFLQSLQFLRIAWRTALANVPRVAPRAQGPDALVEVLRMQPSSVGYSARLATDSLFFAPTPVFASTLDAKLAAHADALRTRLGPAIAQGLAHQERFFDLIPADVSRPLHGSLV